MKVATISDCHGQWARADYPAADVLVMAGDLLRNYDYNRDLDASRQMGELFSLRRFLTDLVEQGRYQEILVVAGNHDFVWERVQPLAQEAIEGDHIHYLQDRELVLEVNGEQRRFYGSPWQPFFGNWAFNFPDHDENPMRAETVAKLVWSLIPENLDVLITHGPPYGVLDECMDGRRVGCKHLANRLSSLNRPPKVHVFGHIHHSFGQAHSGMFVNTAILGEDYQTMRPMPVIEVP